MLLEAREAWPPLGNYRIWMVKLSVSDDFKGKVVILDFWASTAIIVLCRAEIPGLIDLQKTYGKQGLMVVGVSLDQGGTDVIRSPSSRNLG